MIWTLRARLSVVPQCEPATPRAPPFAEHGNGRLGPVRTQAAAAPRHRAHRGGFHPVTAVYDTIGRGYAGQRRADPRLAAAIRAALGNARSVVNVGAGG